MGAVATIDNAAPDAVKQVMEATDGGAAAAIDFVGSPKTIEFGVNVLRKAGKLVMVELYGGACPISIVLFPFKMMTIEGSYVAAAENVAWGSSGGWRPRRARRNGHGLGFRHPGHQAVPLGVGFPRRFSSLLPWV
jgi:threonine dehydrogenase-like Zn-dependent dehydrogenase